MKEEAEKKLLYYYMDANHVVHSTDDIREWVNNIPRARSWHIQDTVQKGVEVSTTFLGVDYSFGRKPLPVLFETMIFGGRRDGESRRYATMDEAKKGHAEIVESFNA